MGAAAKRLVPGSRRCTVLSQQSVTHTDPPPATTFPGWAIRHTCRPFVWRRTNLQVPQEYPSTLLTVAIGIRIRVTASVRGSTRAIQPLPVAAHSAPAPAARLSGWFPTGTTAVTAELSPVTRNRGGGGPEPFQAMCEPFGREVAKVPASNADP